MSKREKILDDIARLAGGAVGLMSDASKHAKENVRIYAHSAAQSIDLVPREDYEALEAIVHDLQARVEILEGKGKNKS